MKTSRILFAPLLLALMLIAAPARAVPQLQLDIAGGTYDTATQSILASSNSFSLYAYGNGVSLTDRFFLSIALVPAVTTGGSYGSFTLGTSTVNVTSGMIYGTPPVETLAGHAGSDPGDLPTHSVFPTYYTERMFQFSSANQSAVYNTQDHAGWGPQTGTGMYFSRFDFNIGNLAPGYGLHFDLYNESICMKAKGQQCDAVGDVDVNKFAPFSHDAQAMYIAPPPPIPEPETYAMMLAGLGLLAFARRRKVVASAS